MSTKKDVESYDVTMWVCPYCENTFEDDEFWAEQCRDRCYAEIEAQEGYDSSKKLLKDLLSKNKEVVEKEETPLEKENKQLRNLVENAHAFVELVELDDEEDLEAQEAWLDKYRTIKDKEL